MEKRMGDITHAELVRRCAVANTAAAQAEHYGWIVAGLVAVGGGFLITWILSIPLAVVLYFATVKPKQKAAEQADAELSAYEQANPPATVF